MRLLHRFRHGPHVFDVHKPAVVGDGVIRLPRPGLDDDSQVLLEAVTGLFDINAEPFELLPLLAASLAEQEPSVREHVDGGGFLSHDDGIVKRQNDHGRAKLDPLCPSGDVSQGREYS